MEDVQITSGLSLILDAAKNRVNVVMKGKVDIAETETFFKKIPDVIARWQAGPGKPSFDSIIDCREVELDFRINQMLSITQFHSDLPPFALAKREVLITPDDYRFGLARMYQSLQTTREIFIARSVEEAEDWLNQTDP